jgi:UDP-2-acetamido-2,6-beta-L-arabino-hexul-4-ose reductase
LRILITGANGFIGKNLIAHLKTDNSLKIETFLRGQSFGVLKKKINQADFIFHLAGENRPDNNQLFKKNNLELTKNICKFIIESNKKIPFVFSSTVQYELKNPYGVSKRNAELVVEEYQKKTKAPVFIYRLTNIYGKWAKPNYNSVVATFCTNIINNTPSTIIDGDKTLKLCYIEDLIEDFCKIIKSKKNGLTYIKVKPIHQITVQALFDTLKSFHISRPMSSIVFESTLDKNLYSTFISYLPFKKFSYPLKLNLDMRGNFVEFLKLSNQGQISFFSINPGHTRGNHYHHFKTEKFLILNGRVKFKFKNLLTGKVKEKIVNGKNPEVIDTVPGWIHNIKSLEKINTVYVILWSNEVFDLNKPDTYYEEI